MWRPNPDLLGVALRGAELHDPHTRPESLTMPDKNSGYALAKQLTIPFDEADARVRELMKEHGFGVLTEIDVRETLKKKLDVDHRPYRILGACNPPLAHRALTAERNVGLLLPCNVIVYEGDEPGTSVVAFMDPLAQLELADNEALNALGREVKKSLTEILEEL